MQEEFSPAGIFFPQRPFGATLAVALQRAKSTV
jgi:hypothetical protein